jgi:hypothetical protein
MQEGRFQARTWRQAKSIRTRASHCGANNDTYCGENKSCKHGCSITVKLAQTLQSSLESSALTSQEVLFSLLRRFSPSPESSSSSSTLANTLGIDFDHVIVVCEERSLLKVCDAYLCHVDLDTHLSIAEESPALVIIRLHRD